MCMTSVQAKKESNRIIDYLKDLKIDFKNNPLKFTFILPVVLFFVIFLVIPTSMVFISAFRTETGAFSLEFFKLILGSEKFIDWGGDTQSKWLSVKRIDKPAGSEKWIILNGKNYGVILNSVIIAVLTTIFSLIIGISLALFMAKRDFIGKKVVSLLILVPLIVPPFVGGVGFFTMLGETGIINEQFLVKIFGVRIILKGIVAMVFVESFHYYTLIYLNVYSSLINIDPSLEEQAKNLGAKGFRLLRTITLPLALPGIAAGSILTFILALEDLGTPIVFGANGDSIAKNTMTYYIFQNLELNNPNSINVIPGDSSVIGTILLLLAVIGFFMIRKYVAMRSYSMTGKGRAGDRQTPKASTTETVLFYIFYTMIFLLSILVHIGVIIRAFSVGPEFPPNWSMENFNFIFSSANDVKPFVINTMVYSLLSLLVIIVFGVMAAYAIARFDFKGKSVFDALITIPIALPGVVIGLGYLVMFSDSAVFDVFGAIGVNTNVKLTLDPFVYPVILLICSYAIRKFPFAVRSIFAGMQQTSVDLEEAAQNMGANRSMTLATITMPLISLNIVAGSLIAFVYTISEVSTTLVLISDQDAGTITWYMGNYAANKISIFAALGVLLMVMQIISLIFSNILLGNRSEAMTGI